MQLRLRHGERRFVVTIPEGSRLVKTRFGYPALVIPSANPNDSAAYILAPRIPDVAARGLHGLSVREERVDFY